MYSVIYVSSAIELLSDIELENILVASRRNNSKADITGMLLYKDGNFMQLLEGPQLAVKSLLDKIQDDPRHRGVLRLLEEETEKRNFTEWAMGFTKLDANTPCDLPGYSDFLNLDLTSEQFVNHPSKCLKLLLSFKKVIR
jgi:hypothetical protein